MVPLIFLGKCPRAWAVLFLAGFAAQAQTSSFQDQAAPYHPITDRLNWFIQSSVGPATLAGGVVSAAWGTMRNAPREYGPHWQGFGQRYGMRLTGVVTGNAMEAGLGAIWGEDPRYPRAVGAPFRGRVWQIVKMTFLAQTEGGTTPAYARYASTVGNNFLSNTWRESSEADVQHALERVALGFLGRMAGNAFAEFWPSVKRRIVRHDHPTQNSLAPQASERPPQTPSKLDVVPRAQY